MARQAPDNPLVTTPDDADGAPSAGGFQLPTYRPANGLNLPSYSPLAPVTVDPAQSTPEPPPAPSETPETPREAEPTAATESTAPASPWDTPSTPEPAPQPAAAPEAAPPRSQPAPAAPDSRSQGEKPKTPKTTARGTRRFSSFVVVLVISVIGLNIANFVLQSISNNLNESETPVSEQPLGPSDSQSIDTSGDVPADPGVWDANSMSSGLSDGDLMFAADQYATAIDEFRSASGRLPDAFEIADAWEGLPVMAVAAQAAYMTIDEEGKRTPALSPTEATDVLICVDAPGTDMNSVLSSANSNQESGDGFLGYAAPGCPNYSNLSADPATYLYWDPYYTVTRIYPDGIIDVYQ